MVSNRSSVAGLEVILRIVMIAFVVLIIAVIFGELVNGIKRYSLAKSMDDLAVQQFEILYDTIRDLPPGQSTQITIVMPYISLKQDSYSTYLYLSTLPFNCLSNVWVPQYDIIAFHKELYLIKYSYSFAADPNSRKLLDEESINSFCNSIAVSDKRFLITLCNPSSLKSLFNQAKKLLDLSGCTDCSLYLAIPLINKIIRYKTISDELKILYYPDYSGYYFFGIAMIESQKPALHLIPIDGSSNPCICIYSQNPPIYRGILTYFDPNIKANDINTDGDYYIKDLNALLVKVDLKIEKKADGTIQISVLRMHLN